jgi:4-amino-4-deoxy-L-arabinose transferase-like glycosyltransferase
MMPDGRPQIALRTPVVALTPLDRFFFATTLAVTLALALILSSNRLMWNDEFLSLYSDSVPTARGVIDVQLHHPISLDPPTYHLLSHFSMDVIGPSAVALRLPAMTGFLLMQISLFALVRRIAGVRSGIVAMLLPPLTASFRYAAEGRPYGLLLGLYAAAFACWFLASWSTGKRPFLLLGLALSIALAITSHYFGILILLPVGVAELVRTCERRKLDAGMLAALALGAASVAIILPFGRGLAPYRTHYYIKSVSVRAVTQGYRELFVRYTALPIPFQRVIAFAMLLATAALAFAALRRFRRRPAHEPASLWAGLATLALLPLFGFLVGRFVTHTMEVRYVIAALLAFAVVIAMLLERRLASRAFYIGVYATTLLAAIAIGTATIVSNAKETRTLLVGMQPSAALVDALAKSPTARIYTQSLGDFYLDTYYAPDPGLRTRFSLIYDEPSEVSWFQHNALFLDYGSGWEWAHNDLNARRIPLQPLGPALRGQLFQIVPR